MAIQQVIHLRYRDNASLAQELWTLFPDGDWRISVAMGSYTLTLPRLLSQAEIDHINSRQRHYQTQGEARRPRK